MDQILQALAQDAGIIFVGVDAEFQDENASLRATHNGFACDAQPALVTVSNAGIPSYLTNYIDPKLIDVLVAPMKAAEVVGSEVKKGDWLSETAIFTVIESTGEISAYGDYNNGGQAGVNSNFPQRQSFGYQVVTQWGEKELERAGLAKIDLANKLNMASILVLNKFQNKSYFYGVAGLQNYGLLNDPNLSAPIAPNTKAATGTSWTNATALEVYDDIAKLYSKLQTQSNALIELETPMTLIMSPTAQVGLTKTTQFNVNVMTLLKTNYPNMKIKTAPEYATASGELLQLIVESMDGQQTADCAFTEKLRAHPVKVELSSFAQKKSQGTWGTVIYRPIFIAQMLGV